MADWSRSAVAWVVVVALLVLYVTAANAGAERMLDDADARRAALVLERDK